MIAIPSSTKTCFANTVSLRDGDGRFKYSQHNSLYIIARILCYLKTQVLLLQFSVTF